MKILISALFTPSIVEKLKSSFDVINLDYDKHVSIPEDDLIKHLSNVDIFITEEDHVTSSVIKSSPNLKAIFSLHGTPVDIDMETATEQGVMVFNTPGRNADAVADLTIALMVMCARNVIPSVNCILSGAWANTPYDWSYFEFRGFELGGKTIGLVGFGMIGQKVAHRLVGFDMEILAYDPYISADQADHPNVEFTTLEDLLRRSDYVSLHIPVTPDTRQMLGKAEFDLMKPTSYLINTARAAVVDESAMIDALRNKKIAGAGLDVFHVEPFGLDYPLVGLDNVVLTPHIGGATHEVIDHHSRIVMEDIQLLLDGKLPKHLVNPDCLAVLKERFLNSHFANLS